MQTMNDIIDVIKENVDDNPILSSHIKDKEDGIYNNLNSTSPLNLYFDLNFLDNYKDPFNDNSQVAYYELSSNLKDINNKYNGEFKDFYGNDILDTYENTAINYNYTTALRLVNGNHIVLANSTLPNMDNSTLAQNAAKHISLWFYIEDIVTNEQIIVDIQKRKPTTPEEYFSVSTKYRRKLYYSISVKFDKLTISCNFPNIEDLFTYTINKHTWYHLAITNVNDDNYYIYLNGSKIGEFSIESFSPDALTIGCHRDNDTDGEGDEEYNAEYFDPKPVDRTINYFNGYISRLRIFNAPLTVKKVNLLYINDSHAHTDDDNNKIINTVISNSLDFTRIYKYIPKYTFTFNNNLNSLYSNYVAKMIGSDPIYGDGIFSDRKALITDGTNTFCVDDDNIGNGGKNFSISLWFSTEGDGTYIKLTNPSAYIFRLYKKNSKFYVDFATWTASNNVTFDKDLEDNKWYKLDINFKTVNGNSLCCDVYIDGDPIVFSNYYAPGLCNYYPNANSISVTKFNLYIGSNVDETTNTFSDHIKSKTSQLRIFAGIISDTLLRDLLYKEKYVEHYVIPPNVYIDGTNTDGSVLSILQYKNDNYDPYQVNINSSSDPDDTTEVIIPTETNNNINKVVLKSLVDLSTEVNSKISPVPATSSTSYDIDMYVNTSQYEQTYFDSTDIDMIPKDNNINFSTSLDIYKNALNEIDITNKVIFDKSEFNDIVKYNDNGNNDSLYKYIKYYTIEDNYINIILDDLDTNKILEYYKDLLYLDISIDDRCINRITIKNNYLLKDNKKIFFKVNNNKYYLNYKYFSDNPTIDIYKFDDSKDSIIIYIAIKSDILTKLNYRLAKLII